MFLNTKFFIPPLPPDHVPRPGLISQLRKGLQQRLLLITAPAGFGKSTVIAELFGADSRPAARLSLDPTDNDANRFWSYFGQGLARIFCGLGAEATATLSSASPPAIREIHTLWLNELASRCLDGCAPGETSAGMLALDDFHLIEHQQIADGLAFFIDHLPPNLRLILSSRQRPELPLTRWRGRGQLCHITARDLQLSRSDSETYLAARLGPEISQEQFTRLYERCEGWPAALQLATSWLADRPSIDGSLRALPVHGDLADYMAEEILAKMTPEIGEQLMRLSILDAFNGPLCAHVLGASEPDRLLDVLQCLNLPVVQLDGDGHWLRFHHLFRDFLRRRLDRLLPGAAEKLHRRAADHFAAESQWQTGFHHARASGDLDLSIDILIRSASARINRGESNALIRDVESLAIELEKLPATLLIELAKASYIAGRTEDCRALIAVLERLDDKGLLEPHLAVLLQVQRAALARSRDGDLATAIQELTQALESLSGKQQPIRLWVTVQLAIAHSYAFELDTAERLLTSQAGPGTADEAHPAPIFSRRANLAQIHFYRGSFRQASELCRRILQANETTPAPLGSPGLSLAFRVLGAVELEQGRFERASRALQQAVRCGRLSGFDELIAFPHLWLAELARAVDDSEELDFHLQEIEMLKARGNLTPAHDSWARALRLHRLLDRGDLPGAERLARRFPQPSGPPSLLDESWRIARMRALASCGSEHGQESRWREAGRAVDSHRRAARRQGRAAVETELALWAVWLDGKHQGRQGIPSDETLDTLIEALESAAELGIVRPFLTPPLTELIKLFPRIQCRSLSIKASDLCRRIETAWRDRNARQGEERPASRGPRLTGKENEVLAGLAEGHSNAQIADELGVAVSTVKTHLKNLFFKLDARRRTQAVARARELGCL